MNLNEGDISEEWLLRFGLLLDVSRGVLHNLLIHQALGGLVEDTCRLHRLASHPFPRLWRGITHLPIELVRAIASLVGRVLDAKPFIEALIGRQSPSNFTKMPFAVRGSGIASLGKELGDRVFPWCKTGRALAWERHARRARPHGQPAGHDGCPRGRALCLDGIVVKAQAVLRDGINARRRNCPTIYAEIAPADVVR